MIKLEDVRVGTNNDKITDRVTFDSKDLNWDVVPEGKYNGTLAIVYPAKKFIRDQWLNVKGDDGRWIKGDDGEWVKEFVKDLSWEILDIVIRIDGGDYDGYAVRGNLSTHPSWVGKAKQFLFNANLFDVGLDDLFKHTGTPVIVNVKTRENTYTDKTTGMEVSKTESYVDSYDKMSNDIAGL